MTRSWFTDLDETRIHCAELGGSGSKPPLILIHGLNDSFRTWKHVAPALAADRRVLMPDLPGHGRSGRPNASYELGWHAHVIADWLKAAGLEQVDVLGHSYGGGVAQMLLFECPERVRRLVLLASGGLGRGVGLGLRLVSLQPLAVERFGQPWMGHCTRLALRGGLRDEADVEELCAINSEQGSARAFARTVRDVVDWRGQRRLFMQRAHEVANLPPILLCWGDRDRLLPFAQGKDFAERVDGVVFKAFPGAGHYLHHERPAQLVAIVRGFLDDPRVPAARLRAEPVRTSEAAKLRWLWKAVSGASFAR